MKRTRAAYWREFKKIAIESKMAKELPEYEIIELSAPVSVPVRWKEKVTRKEGKVWRERNGLAEYQPGEVLHREWRRRRASSWEIEEWSKLSSEVLKSLGVFKQDGKYSIQIVEKIKDLRAAIRQRCRHILARTISRTKLQFELLGDAQLLESYVSKLTSLVQKILQIRRPSDVFDEELGQIALQLEGAKSELKRHALQEIKQAQQQKLWKSPVHVSQAATDLLQERAKDYEIAVSSLELAEKWFRLMTDIERRFRNCYQRLGQLGQKLQEEILKGEVSPSVLFPIAQEAHGIWKYLLEQIPNFEPYYSRLQEPEFQRLSRILEHAERRRAKTVYNDIEGAIAKLEAIAIGEKPTWAEISRQKERFSIGPSK